MVGLKSIGHPLFKLKHFVIPSGLDLKQKNIFVQSQQNFLKEKSYTVYKKVERLKR